MTTLDQLTVAYWQPALVVLFYVNLLLMAAIKWSDRYDGLQNL